jgi:lambda family phage portal protein
VVVPAEQIIHVKIMERPGQTRGVTWFASAILRLHHLAGYQEAEVIRARAASSLMGFIRSQEGVGEALGENVVDGEHVTQFEPGVIKTLFEGQDITVPDLHAPDGQFEPFVRAMLRGMAAGLGVSYETLSKDYSQTNYSSSRLALLDDRENWRVLQDYMIRTFHERVFRAWLRAAVASGDLQLPGYEVSPERFENVKWVARGWDWVDPQTEGQASREAVRDGLMTQAEVVLSRGGDYNELIEARAAELDEQKELGLVFDTNPSEVAKNGAEQFASGTTNSTGGEAP